MQPCTLARQRPSLLVGCLFELTSFPRTIWSYNLALIFLRRLRNFNNPARRLPKAPCMAALEAARAAAASLSSPRPPEIHFSVAVASTPHVEEAIVRASVEVERINLAALNPCATWSMPSPDTRPTFQLPKPWPWAKATTVWAPVVEWWHPLGDADVPRRLEVCHHTLARGPW